MAKNPMDRRRKTSFLLGVAVMGVLTLIISIALFAMWNKKSDELKKEKSLSKLVDGILTTDLKSNEEIKDTYFKTEKVRVSCDLTDIVTPSVIMEATKQNIKLYAKVPVKQGMFLTKDMIYRTETDQKAGIDSSERLYDLNGISLPERTQKGDTVDIRISLPSLQDYVVISKKIVEETSQDTVWLKLNEVEIRTFSSALMESYMIKGAKLYATLYTEPGLQKANAITYPVNATVIQQLGSDIQGGLVKILGNFNDFRNQQQQLGSKRNSVSANVSNDPEERIEAIATGVQREVRIKEEKRKEFLSSIIAAANNDLN